MEGPIKTEFNSSVACLMRIDELIKVAHKARLNLYPDDSSPRMFCDALEGIYVEGTAKFNDKEKEKCKEYQLRILKTKEGYSKYLNSPFIPNSKNPNPLFKEGWNKILNIAKQYELLLMELLSSHGMLMTDKEEVDLTDF